MNTETRRKIRTIANKVSTVVQEFDDMLDQLNHLHANEHLWIQAEKKGVKRDLGDLQAAIDLRNSAQILQHMRAAISHLKASSSNAHGVVTQLIEASA